MIWIREGMGIFRLKKKRKKKRFLMELKQMKQSIFAFVPFISNKVKFIIYVYYTKLSVNSI